MIQFEVTSGLPVIQTDMITGGAALRDIDDSWSESVILWSADRQVGTQGYDFCCCKQCLCYLVADKVSRVQYKEGCSLVYSAHYKT